LVTVSSSKSSSFIRGRGVSELVEGLLVSQGEITVRVVSVGNISYVRKRPGSMSTGEPPVLTDVFPLLRPGKCRDNRPWSLS
jgi:hypothetical protein